MAKVLIIDDDEDARTMMVRICTNVGVETILASNGVDIEGVMNPDVVLALLDWEGDSQGLECARFIRKRFPGVCVYIFSGADHGTIANTLHAEKVSVAGIIDKPAHMEEIERVVLSALAAARGEWPYNTA